MLSPGGKGLQLHRRLSKHACPKLPERWIAGRETEQWRPWAGTVEAQQIDDAMLRPAGEELELALPADGDALPLAEYAPNMQKTEINGRAFLVLKLRDGAPVAAEEDAETPESEG